jgi:hypothetical protein
MLRAVGVATPVYAKMARPSWTNRSGVMRGTPPRTLAQAKRYAREALVVWLDLSTVDELDAHGPPFLTSSSYPAE